MLDARTLLTGLGDVWRFNLTSKYWTWVAGNITAATVLPVYNGSASSITPGSNSGHGACVASGTDKLYMYGAVNNELWSFDFWTSFWTLISSGGPSGSYAVDYQYPAYRSSASLHAIAGTPLLFMVILIL